MAIDHNSVPNDPLSLNPNRHLFTASTSVPFQPSSRPTAGDSFVADESVDDQPSARKVKLLCSFGGKILPRPSDGALRYAGGQTRIIAVRRDTTLPELCRKMADAYGGPVAIRYQLPDEDLDALVSVSSPEDLDNMMDEYDKLAEVSGDGSAKLRVFLFSQAEIASFLAENLSAGPTLIDPYDGGQEYIEAVNGGFSPDAGICASDIRPKGSIASASSTQNSDAGFDGSNNEGVSPAIVSPVAGASSFNPSILAFPASSTVFSQSMVATQSLNPPPVVPYASQAFVEPYQVHYMPPHSLNMDAASRMVNVGSVPQHTYLPSLPTPTSSMPGQLGCVKPVQEKLDPFSEEDQLSGRFIQHMSDPNYKVFQQPLSQIPPLRPSHLPPPSIERYRLHQVSPLSQGPVLSFEDCQMCQKALPHVHSDRLVNELGNVAGVHASNDHPIVHSYHSEDIARLQGNHRIFSGEMMESPLELKVEYTLNPSHNVTYGTNKVPESILDREKLFGLTAEKIDLSMPKQPLGADYTQVLHPSGTIGLSSTGQTSYGVSLGPSQRHHDESFQQQHLPAGTAPPFFPAKQAVIGKQGGKDSSSINNVSYNVLEPLSHARDYVKQVDGIMEALNVSTIDILRSSDQLKPPIVPNVGVPKDMKPENLTAVGDNHTFRQQNGANALLSSNAFSTSGIRPEGICIELVNPVVLNTGISREIRPESSLVVGEDNNAVSPHRGVSKIPLHNAYIGTGFLPKENPMGPINPLLSSMMELHTSELANACQASIIAGSSLFHPQNFERGTKHLPANQQIPAMPPYTDPVYANTIAEGTNRVWKGEVSQVQSLFNDMAASQRGNVPFPGQGRQFQETIAPCLLLENEDDEEILGSMNAYLPRPAIVATREPTILGDPLAENRLPMGQSPDIAVLLEEGALQPPVDWLIKESLSDPVLDSVADINQDLHDLAEQVGESVLQSSPPVSVLPFSDKNLPKEQSLDIEVLLEEGALQSPADWLIKESCPDALVGTKDIGVDYINQDLRELAEQVVESVLQPSTPPLSVLSCNDPKEMSLPFLREIGLSENNSNLQSGAVQGDQRVEDIKARESDKLHMGLLMANDSGRLQIIKNSDLEELRELGSGTFGTVYHGKWRGSDVAIKRINDRCFAGKPSEQEKMRDDFWNEASKLADLHHPNVVAFYGVVIDGLGGSFATVTEYMVNGSLRNALQKDDKTFDRRRCLLIAMDVAFGMEYLHSKNIVHFDLKSDNLLVNLRDPQRPICKVGDLGLSKVKCKTLISGGVRGTLPWMAPELLNGSSILVSEKVDVFSFGIVMWELLTGDEPYSDLHYGAIIGGIVSNTLRPAVPDSCDPEWGALMEQCWSSEPTERPSFTEIANRLRSMAASVPQKGQAQK